MGPSCHGPSPGETEASAVHLPCRPAHLLPLLPRSPHCGRGRRGGNHSGPECVGLQPVLLVTPTGFYPSCPHLAMSVPWPQPIEPAVAKLCTHSGHPLRAGTPREGRGTQRCPPCPQFTLWCRRQHTSSSRNGRCFRLCGPRRLYHIFSLKTFTNIKAIVLGLIT